MSELTDAIRKRIRDIPDFPEPGILFKDITPVLADPQLFPRVVEAMADGWPEVDAIVGIESRGFIFAAAMVEKLGKGFVPARKKGKLPHLTVSVEYELEYGTAILEIHKDAFPAGAKVLVVDDLLATGGTAAATIDLCRQLGAEVVGCSFLVELGFLPGREALEKLDVPVRALITY